MRKCQTAWWGAWENTWLVGKFLARGKPRTASAESRPDRRSRGRMDVRELAESHSPIVRCTALAYTLSHGEDWCQDDPTTGSLPACSTTIVKFSCCVGHQHRYTLPLLRKMADCAIRRRAFKANNSSDTMARTCCLQWSTSEKLSKPRSSLTIPALTSLIKGVS